MHCPLSSVKGVCGKVRRGGYIGLIILKKVTEKNFLITVARAISKGRLDLIIKSFYFVSLTNFLS